MSRNSRIVISRSSSSFLSFCGQSRIFTIYRITISMQKALKMLPYLGQIAQIIRAPRKIDRFLVMEKSQFIFARRLRTIIFDGHKIAARREQFTGAPFSIPFAMIVIGCYWYCIVSQVQRREKNSNRRGMVKIRNNFRHILTFQMLDHIGDDVTRKIRTFRLPMAMVIVIFYIITVLQYFQLSRCECLRLEMTINALRRFANTKCVELTAHQGLKFCVSNAKP